MNLDNLANDAGVVIIGLGCMMLFVIALIAVVNSLIDKKPFGDCFMELIDTFKEDG